MSIGAAVLAAGLAAGAAATPADDDPISWVGDVAGAGGTVRVEGEQHPSASSSGASGDVPRLVVRVWYIRACRSGAAPVMGGSASCEVSPCETRDGLPGTRKHRLSQLEDVVEGTAVGPVRMANPVCVPLPLVPDDLHERVLRAFRELGLPGVGVRTDPSGLTLVHWPTRFTVEPGWSGHSLGRILGRRVRVEITPVRYVWEFGDGATRRTGPRASVLHAYDRAGQVRASVTATYRARYRVEGGPPRGIPGRVVVAGPATALDVRSVRTQLVAGAR